MDYNRRSIRLNGFDYSNNGYYFVTVCVQNKLKIFCNLNNKRADTSVRPYIESNQIICPYIKSEYLNNIGLMVDYWFNEISNHFENVILDEYVIMPDHIHFILMIKCNRQTPHKLSPNIPNVGVDRCVDPIINKKTLGNIIQWFKTMTTNEYIKNVKIKNWPRFDKRLWQRDYYERIIRNEKEYLRIKEYIRSNPKMWGRDKNNIENN